MIEYPSIMHCSKAPRKFCVAFDKMDGSNIRVKWTHKKGFCLFGSRTQLLDESHPYLGSAITYFKKELESKLEPIFNDYFRDEREAIAFGEFFGPNSFAGLHVLEDPKKIVLFDVLVGHKNRKFILPQEFIKLFVGVVETPRVIYIGNLNDQFIAEVKEGKHAVVEGVICKGTERNGAFRGGVWMTKIKTQKYLEKLKEKYGEEGFKNYW